MHTHIHTSTRMHAYIHRKETQFYTVNNAMYPWHNQKDSAKAIAIVISLFVDINAHILGIWNCTYKIKTYI